MRDTIILTFTPKSAIYYSPTEDTVIYDIAEELMMTLESGDIDEKAGPVLNQLAKLSIQPEDAEDLVPYISADPSALEYFDFDMAAELISYAIQYSFNFEGYIENFPK